MSDAEQSVFYSHIGQKINQIRRARNLSQNVLGQIVGLSRTSIVNIERGKHRVQTHTLVEIANALKIDLSDMLPVEITINENLLSDIPKNLKPDEKNSVAKFLQSHRKKKINETKNKTIDSFSITKS